MLWGESAGYIISVIMVGMKRAYGTGYVAYLGRVRTTLLHHVPSPGKTMYQRYVLRAYILGTRARHSEWSTVDGITTP